MGMIGNFLAISQETLDAITANPKSVADVIYPQGAMATGILDVDKAWQGIHFLLTGSAWEGSPPWSLVILGGTGIGPDIGYGPARYLTADQVREVAKALSTLSSDELKKRYSPTAMSKAGVYPDNWGDDDDLSYLIPNYEAVVEYYQAAARKNQAMLLFIN